MMFGIQALDYVARRRSDGEFDVLQCVGTAFRPVAGPLDRTAAKARAVQLAISERSRAWIEDIVGEARQLDPR
jgi:hypothetical protein